MADDSYRLRFPGLYRRWTGHDLANHGPEPGSFRPEFCETLRREEEPVVPRFIIDLSR